MSETACRAPVADERLVEYWLGELPREDEERLEEHCFGCASCEARLAEVAALGAGIRAAFRGGGLHVVISPALLATMHRAGLRIREYPVAAGGSVNCTIAASDDFVVSRLAAPLGGVERLDLLFWAEGGPEALLEDIAFDPAAGEVLFCPSPAHLKQMPAHIAHMRLVARAGGAERTLGEYTFKHTPS